MAASIDREAGIIIRGIGPACTDDMLEDAFKEFGAITDTFIKTGRGYAFVTFQDKGSVAYAMDAAPATIGSDTVTVEARSAPRPRKVAEPSTNVYIKGLSEVASEEDVQAVVSGFGTVTSLEVADEGRGFAFVGFESVDAATAMVNAAPLTIAGVQTSSVEFRLSKPRGSRPARERKPPSEKPQGEKRSKRKPQGERRKRKIKPNSVYLKGIPVDSTDEAISAALEGFGPVASVSHREGRDFAFVVMGDADAMEKAVASGSVTVGDNAVVVEERTGAKPKDAAAAAEEEEEEKA